MLQGHRCTYRFFIVHKRYFSPHVRFTVAASAWAHQPESYGGRTRREFEDILGFPTPSLAANGFAPEGLLP